MLPDALLLLCLAHAAGEVIGMAVIARNVLTLLHESLASVACLKPREMILEVVEITRVWCLLFSVHESLAGLTLVYRWCYHCRLLLLVPGLHYAWHNIYTGIWTLCDQMPARRGMAVIYVD